MTNEIIELLPSSDLKAKIKETDHRFQENELLQIIYRYAPTLDSRLKLLARFAEVASPELSALARAYIAYGQEGLEQFAKASADFIYELHIKVTPESYDERYLCASYKDALACIDRFYEEYADIDTKETSQTRYRIEKRKVFSDEKRFEEDSYGECVLGENKNVLEVYNYHVSAECVLDIPCSNCAEICPRRCDTVLYPCFAQERDIIKYQGADGTAFGVCLYTDRTEDGLCEDLCVISLDSHILRDHLFEEEFYDHFHIEPPLATLSTPDELDEVSRRNYFAFVEFLNAR